VSSRLGLELGPTLVRAVRLERRGGRPRIVELHWDPDAPMEMAGSLRESLGPAGRIAVTVDLSFLFAKQVRLPPVSAGEKRRILALEPERFFPVRGEELILAARESDNLVFAARASLLESWLAALETLGPVELMEPAPVSLARALGRVDGGKATLVLQTPDETIGIAEVGDGRLRQVRRAADPQELGAAIQSAADAGQSIYLRPLNGNANWNPGEVPRATLPSVAGVAPSHLAAYGAVLGLGDALDESLLPADVVSRIGSKRRRSLLLAGLTSILALLFVLLSLDGLRSRTLSTLETESARLRHPAEQALALQRQADALESESRAVSAIDAERMDPPGALAALTRRLPPGAYLTSVRGSGRDWQIDGYAPEAAPLVGRLEEDPLFDRVHFLTATSRTRMNGKVYESFSIALRLVPAP
jgi:Tfp pilus assembly protein PilN